MRRLRMFVRLRIRRKYWICREVANEVHVYPNKDTVQHEADACPCGALTEAVPRDDGSIGWVVTHWSLDAREAEER